MFLGFRKAGKKRLQKNLYCKDSFSCKSIIKYKRCISDLKSKIKNPPNNTGAKEYVPEFDSLKTSFIF